MRKLLRFAAIICVGMAQFGGVPRVLSAEPPEQNTTRIVALGDSDTQGKSGYSGSFPGQLEKILKERGHNVRVFNEGIESQTSDQVAKKLDSTVPVGTNIVLIQLGSSDVKINKSPEAIKKTIGEIIDRLVARNIKVVIIAARLPGPKLTAANYDRKAYGDLFYELSRERHLPVANFQNGLPPVGSSSEIYLPDGHLTTAGNAIVARNLVDLVERLLPPKS